MTRSTCHCSFEVHKIYFWGRVRYIIITILVANNAFMVSSLLGNHLTLESSFLIPLSSFSLGPAQNLDDSTLLSSSKKSSTRNAPVIYNAAQNPDDILLSLLVTFMKGLRAFLRRFWNLDDLVFASLASTSSFLFDGIVMRFSIHIMAFLSWLCTL